MKLFKIILARILFLLSFPMIYFTAKHGIKWALVLSLLFLFLTMAWNQSFPEGPEDYPDIF